MVGFDDHTSIMGEWMTPNQSPSGDFSSLISDNVKTSSVAVSVSENKCGHLFSGNSDNRDQARAVVGDEASNSNAARQMSSRGGLVERMAARAGINVPRLDTDSIRPADLSKIPEVQSPYLTIPPGLSPTTLLDSPVFLSNLSVLPSPTTGKFSFASTGNNLYPALMTEDRGMGKRNTCVEFDASSFAFQTVAESGLSRCFNTVNEVNPSCSLPPYASVDVYRAEPPKAPSQNNGTVFQQTNCPISYAEDDGLSNHSSEPTYNSANAAQHSPPLDEPHEDDGDQLSNGDPNAGGSPSEDGYNWRKYGQKQVKGSEYPRSYYKCIHPNCPVKKKVERSEEGDITEIIYKGAHNHLRPPFNRRLALGSSNPLGDVQLGSEQHGTGANDTLMWSTLQKGNLEVTQSTGLSQEYGIGANYLHTQTGQLELGDGVEGSSTFSNEDDDDDRVTHGSVSLGYDGEGDESESKRRRIETYASDISGATRAIREPRVVVQTTSEVDILDDGYRWRKYGQKVVKGNPNPRSYYKCTSPGCNVRKHVERASHDLKSVITTYEGKHDHNVPAARNSSHVNSVSSHPTQQAPVATTSSSLIRRPQPSQVHVGTSPFKTTPVGSFGGPQLGLGLGPGFGFGVNQPGFASLALAGLGPNQGRLPVLPVHAYLGNQFGPMGNNLGFMMPKGEPKMEPVTDSGLNPPNASSVYQQLMSRLPLGPQM